MTTRTIVLDIDDDERTLRVNVQRHPVDFHNLADDVAERITATIVKTPMGCHYFNPIVSISCSEPTPAFFAIIEKEQSRWCRQASKTFPRNIRRSPSRWVGAGEWISDKYSRFLDRALCFTGVLFINGQLILPHNWPNVTTPPSSSRIHTKPPEVNSRPSPEPLLIHFNGKADSTGN